MIMTDNMNRVFLWCVPRTLSTVLLKCLSFVEGLQVVNEPYNCAFHVGPERKKPDWPDLQNHIDKYLFELYDHASRKDDTQGFGEKLCTYNWIREEILEASYGEKTILVCKDMAHYLDSRFDELPRGFKHSFLIRHPIKVFMSWKKMYVSIFGEHLADDLQILPEYVFPAGRGFKELYELMKHVEEDLGQDIVVMDTDDLLDDPEGILSVYFQKMGIPFSQELLSWDASDAVTKTWVTPKSIMNANNIASFFEEAFHSSEFRRSKPPPMGENIPDDVRQCAEACMVYYDKLREKRIRSSHLNHAR